jgi:thermosome
MNSNNDILQILGEGVKRSSGNQSRRYNLLAARLIAELVKNSLGPGGLEKMFIDILGEITVTKDGATLLRKIDVEHPAVKVLIDASNTVDNEVGDGTTSVVVLAGALMEKAEELLDMGIAPTTIIDGFMYGLDISLDTLHSISLELENSDRNTMEKIATTALGSKAIFYNFANDHNFSKILVDAVCGIADFRNKQVEIDDIKIEEKLGNVSETQLIKGVVIDKTIDNPSMPKIINEAKILLIDIDLDIGRTKTNAEIHITSPYQINLFLEEQSLSLLDKVQKIINSGANIVISKKGISDMAQSYLSKAGIMSIRRVKENDILWIEKATGAKLTRELDNTSKEILGHVKKVYEKLIGDDKMVFVEGCKDPRSVTLLLRANSKRYLDEYHRSVLDVLFSLRNFIFKPYIVGGGGAVEMIISSRIRDKANSITGKEQIVIQKFADALEEIPLTIARNSGMNIIDTFMHLRSKYSNQHLEDKKTIKWYGIDSAKRKISEMFSCNIIELSIVKEQILKTMVEVSTLLIRVDDVLMQKPAMYTHTHDDGTTHSHSGGDKKHDHHFDRLGKQQRPMHHYY